MPDMSKFLQVITGRFDATRNSRVDQFRARLASINDQLEELKAQYDSAFPDQRPLYGNYLAVLDDKCAAIARQLDELGPDAELDVELIRKELRDARQRLKIARQAAKARFLH